MEQIPGLTPRYGQHTERLRSALAAVGLALAGRASARLAAVLGMSVSRSTILRLVDALPASNKAWTAACRVRSAKRWPVGHLDVRDRREQQLLQLEHGLFHGRDFQPNHSRGDCFTLSRQSGSLALSEPLASGTGPARCRLADRIRAVSGAP